MSDKKSGDTSQPGSLQNVLEQPGMQTGFGLLGLTFVAGPLAAASGPFKPLVAGGAVLSSLASTVVMADGMARYFDDKGLAGVLGRPDLDMKDTAIETLVGITHRMGLSDPYVPPAPRSKDEDPQIEVPNVPNLKGGQRQK